MQIIFLILPNIYHYFQNSLILDGEEVRKRNVEYNLIFDHFVSFSTYELPVLFSSETASHKDLKSSVGKTQFRSVVRTINHIFLPDRMSVIIAQVNSGKY